MRFGVFELNPTTGELRKHGTRIRLQDQPLKLLLCLLETPGVICGREDFIRKIWPEGTFVDYEHGLNAAVTRLRQALGDAADGPRYVETVGRKGYRFIAPIDRLSAPEIIQPDRKAIDRPVTGVVVPQEASSKLRSSRFWPYVAILTIALAIVAAVGWWRVTHQAPTPLVRLSIDLGPELTAVGPGFGTTVALSPDGTRIAVTARGADGKFGLATRRLDQSQFTQLSGTDWPDSPFFSPDGQWIAFFADRKLKKVEVQSGAPVTLGEAPANFPTGSWGDDGNIVAALNSATGLTRIPSTGGPLVRVLWSCPTCLRGCRQQTRRLEFRFFTDGQLRIPSTSGNSAFDFLAGKRRPTLTLAGHSGFILFRPAFLSRRQAPGVFHDCPGPSEYLGRRPRPRYHIASHCIAGRERHACLDGGRLEHYFPFA